MSKDATRVPGTRGLAMEEPLIFERSVPGRGYPPYGDGDFPEVDLQAELGEQLRGDENGLPEVSEPEAVRHYTRLSQWNYGIDTGMFPLGSCTMKHNPKTADAMAALPGFANLHPLTPDAMAQGFLQLMYELKGMLAEVSGFDDVSLQPAAGAHGELTGLKLIRAYHESRARAEGLERSPRNKVIVTDSAHGTNPASSSLTGWGVTEIKGGDDDIISVEAVAEAMNDEVAALMLTIPNTVGIFERNIKEIAEVVHAGGGMVYCDGANLNALMGESRPGDWGVDVMQFNLHKTFATPHGGGGPGAGPIGIKSVLAPYQPTPVVVRRGEGYALEDRAARPESIGRMRSFMGNTGVMVRAYSYICEHGGQGLNDVSRMAVLNANYLRAQLRDYFHVHNDTACMHEVVFTDKKQKAHGVQTLDIAKRLLDKGFHPPTIYFPLHVHGALLTEPTETESVESLDSFVAAMIEIAKEAESNPELLKSAPHHTVRGRFDEATAARKPQLTWVPASSEE